MNAGGSIRFAVYFGAITVTSIVAALVTSHLLMRILLAWVAFAAGLVAITYLTGSPRLFFKRSDGSRFIEMKPEISGR